MLSDSCVCKYIVANTCCISRGMGVRKCTKFEDSSLSRSRYTKKDQKRKIKSQNWGDLGYLGSP